MLPSIDHIAAVRTMHLKPIIQTLAVLTSTCHFAFAGEPSDMIRKVLPSERQTPQWVSNGANQKWSFGIYRWYYNPSGQPVDLSTEDIVTSLQTAAARWAQVCNVTIQYMGTTSAVPEAEVDGQPDYINVWGWRPLWGDMTSTQAYSVAWTTGDSSRIVDSDIVINSRKQWDLTKIDGVLTHEIGHSLGLDHSDVSTSIMFDKPYHAASYLRTLRGDDVEGCTALYGATAYAMVERTMNWAEQAYAHILYNLGTAPTVLKDGVRYRYYQYSRNYAIEKGGRAYYMDASGAMQDLGPVSNFETQVKAAGF